MGIKNDRAIPIVDGVVVLYNPAINVMKNIQTYVSDLRILYVIDNSTRKNTTLISRLSNVENVQYIDAKGNQGIAQGLNVGADLAIKKQADWLLTMDQDSSFSQGEATALLTQLSRINNKKNLGILSARQNVESLVISKRDGDNLIPQESVMTSGNLLNLTVYKTVGPFLNDYFIDCVDHEYCLRLKKYGYQVLMCMSIPLNHALGDIKSKKVFGRTVYFTNHSSIRRYYMTRNRLDMCFRYFLVSPYFTAHELLKMCEEYVKIILFEDDKTKKTWATLKGIGHFLTRRFGKH